jgi:RND family efflux transporter MFP subunit
MSRPPKWPFFLFILAGVGAIFYLKQHKAPPQQQAVQEQAVHVRTIAVPKVDLTPHIAGHGSVRPVRVWEAVAQVKGKIVAKHPRLQRGAIIEQGTEILRIDPTDYKLAIARTKADMAATRAQLEELDVRERNARASLAVEQQSLDLIAKELERKRDLIGRGGISASDVENEERALLSQRQKVLTQKNSLNLIPSQRTLLEAQLARHQASLDSSVRDLEHTSILMPFSGRIAEAGVELDRYVREGEVLAIADDLARAEVEVQLPIDRFASLIRGNGPIDIVSATHDGFAKELRLSATVRLQENGIDASWPARFARVSDTLDPKTRTVGVIVEVERPYDAVEPGVRPPLLKGLFVEVELRGPQRQGLLIVPRHALRQDRLFIANPENRLEIRKVEISMRQPEFAVIAVGIKEGEQLIISDLIPAIDGMLLKPSEDDAARQRLLDAVTSPANRGA